ncbi:MAG TPA: anthranilate synthase component I [Candidatus Krumholzibacteria bacterium]|nr:anthranilate synthase component I [Candidatus Krumholzibacteria bacterium]
MLMPTRDEFDAAARRGRVVPLRQRVPADLETPVSAFLKLTRMPDGQRARFLLESVERGIQVGRYSFIGVSPSATLRLDGDTLTIDRGGAVTRVALSGRDPLAFVRDEIARMPVFDDSTIPGPFAGAVGYISYEVARHFERLPAASGDGLGLPDYYFMIPRTLVIFDHVRSEMEIVAIPPEGDPGLAYDAAREAIEAILTALSGPLPHRNGHRPEGVHASPDSNMTREEFEASVRASKEHILAGDAFQVVVSQRLSARTTTDPFQIYRALRITNPSPYMFFLDADGFQLVGSSPEVLVKLEKRRATVSPIAGTRPRGQTAAEDLALEEELLGDDKERAEHVMLVDLGRNDLGRVCDIGSVATESLMHVEKYSHVMHIVSTVAGRLREGLDAFDLLRACFPAGTVTGAPKIRAMEIIATLERDRRGPYAGALGYFGHQGDMDMCITIRTIVMIGDRYHVQAGAGIVADSDPACEFEETLSKARALVNAVSVAENGL